MSDINIKGDLTGLVNIDEVKNMLDVTLKSQYSVIDYLKSVYESTDTYKRMIAMNISDYEFTTSQEIYDLLGIKLIKYNSEDSLTSLYGSTDMLLLFPHLVNLKTITYILDFHITNLGSLHISDIYDKYTYLNDPEYMKKHCDKNSLRYTFDLSYLYDMNIYYIDKSIRMQYMLENVKYIVFDYMPSSLKDLNRFLGDIIDDLNYYNLDMEEKCEGSEAKLNKEKLNLKDITLDLILTTYVDDDLDLFNILDSFLEIFNSITISYDMDCLNDLYMDCNYKIELLNEFLDKIKSRNIKLRAILRDKELNFVYTVLKNSDVVL